MVDVLVKADAEPTQTVGDWLVKVGRGRGGKNISRHRLKQEAEKRARREPRKRQRKGRRAVLWMEDRNGRERKVHTYEPNG